MPAGQDFFCHLPFVALQTDGVTAAPCCKFQSESRLLLDQYQDHDEILQVKSLLFQGLSPKQCRTCVREEQQTGKSFRTLANDFHPELSAEVRLHDQNYSSLRHVSVSGSNVCNLQCLPCEHGSFKRSTELHALGFYPTIPVLRKLDNVQILSDLPIENLTLCSGEPFYDKQSRKLLELLRRCT